MASYTKVIDDDNCPYPERNCVDCEYCQEALAGGWECTKRGVGTASGQKSEDE